MYRYVILFFLIISKFSFSQTEITWQDLEDVEFSEVFIEKENAYVLFPHFGSKVNLLNNQEVTLTGYILTIDPSKGYCVLSKGPFASCFFCGKGGPESVVELDFKSNKNSFVMDQFVTIKGILRLNEDDIYRCVYILENAEIYK